MKNKPHASTFDYQGKRPDQVAFSEKMVVISAAGMVILVVVLLILNSFN